MCVEARIDKGPRLTTCGEFAAAIGVRVDQLVVERIRDAPPRLPHYCLCGLDVKASAVLAGFDAKLNETFDLWTLTRKADP